MYKQIIAAGMLACASLSLMAQQSFTIKGNLKDTSRNGEKVILKYYNGEKTVNAASLITNGQFSFEGTVVDPTRAKITINPTRKMVVADLWTLAEECEFFIEEGDIILEGYPFKKAVLKAPGQSQKDFQVYQQAVKPFKEKEAESYISMLHNLVDKKLDAKKRDSILNVRYKQQVDSVEIAFLERHPGAHISLDLLRSRVHAKSLFEEGEKLAAWYNRLSDVVKNTKTGKQLGETIATAAQLAPGKPAKDFVLNDTLGNPVQLASFKGKYVLLDFWASWCMPCRAENPAVIRAYERFKDKNFTVIGVSLEKPGDRKSWVAAIQKDKLPWYHVAPLKQEERDSITKLYGIQSIPMNFLIDPQGKIIATYLRGEELMKKLEEIL